MSFTLRRLTRDEMERAAVVHRTTFDERLPWLAGLHTPDQDRAFFRDRVFEACEVWGAFDDELIGFIAFRTEWIDQLYVLPHRQGQGIGCALLGIAMEASASLQLWTFQRNGGAQRFYEKQGLVAIEETAGTRNMEREPDVLYRWEREGDPLSHERTYRT